MTEFTRTELIMISLVMGQNADQYGEPQSDAYQEVMEISTKAREIANAKASSDSGTKEDT